ncbi:MAG: hypothetical protein AAF488_03620 [Planctomycetota bacterium]
MVKVLERQLGAQNIELDTRAGWAEFDVPNRIDVAGLVKAMVDAGYTMERVDYRVEGRVEKGAEGTVLVMAKNDQRLPVRGVDASGPAPARVTAQGWVKPGQPIHFTKAEKVVKTQDR